MSLIRDNTQLDNLPNFCIKKEKNTHTKLKVIIVIIEMYFYRIIVGMQCFTRAFCTLFLSS